MALFYLSQYIKTYMYFQIYLCKYSLSIVIVLLHCQEYLVIKPKDLGLRSPPFNQESSFLILEKCQ